MQAAPTAPWAAWGILVVFLLLLILENFWPDVIHFYFPWKLQKLDRSGVLTAAVS
jgi:hypothetical protein